jgi:hypothetical protein
MGIVGRRLRGIFGMGSLWALSWGAVFGAINAVGATVIGEPLAGVLTAALINGVLGGAFLGFLIGSLFGAILVRAERGRGVSSLSLIRFATWGALAGGAFSAAIAVLPGSTLRPSVPIAIGLMSVIGAVSAAASLALARLGVSQADASDPASVEAFDPGAPLLDAPTVESMMGAGRASSKSGHSRVER